MKETKVSVLISTYNIEPYIGECISSIQRQMLDNIEIICVDDCSTDGTVAVIKEYMARDSRIILLEHKENGGPARSRNTGCRKARGRYIWFIDGDDYIKDGALARLYNLSETNNLDVLSFSGEAFVDTIFKDGSKYAAYKNFYKRKTKFDGVFTGQELFSEYINRGEILGNLYLQFIRRSLYIENNLYANEDRRYGQDDPFGIYMYAKRCMCIPEVLYMRRFRPDSQVTRKKGFEDAESYMLGLIDDLRLWERLNLPNQFDSSTEKYFVMLWNAVQLRVSKISLAERQFKILNKYPSIKFIMEYFILGKSSFDSLPDKLLDSLTEKGCIVLYGAGKMADTIAYLLEKHRVFNYSVVVTSKSDYNKFHGKDVVEASQWNGNWKNSVVIIAIKAQTARDEISVFLQGKGCRQVILP